MITFPKIAKLDIPVSERLLQAITNVYNRHLDKRELRKTPPLTLEVLRLQPEMATEWLIEGDEDVNIIREFAETYFDTVMGCRIHWWQDEPFMMDIPHEHPRIFIPVSNDYCVYGIVDSEGKTHQMNFKTGNCYVWDVRNVHTVYMHRPEIPRVVGIFLFDPEKETKFKGL